MLSPFPGMDPYLEDPAIFPDLHDRLIAVLGDATFLNLPAGYFAVIGRQTWIDVADQWIGADVKLRQGNAPRSDLASIAATADSTVAPLVIHVAGQERQRTFVEIYQQRGPKRRLITVIEVLSPSNKTSRSSNRKRYLRKQRELLDRDVHLVEIDLLRSGRHTTAVPLADLKRKAGEFAYHICIHRFDRLDDYLVYPRGLRESLGTFHVPLHPKDTDLPVNLQVAFDRCYAAGPYQFEVDYSASPPKPPLSAENLAWVRERLVTVKSVQ